jgi:hypothetical protein
MRKETLRLVLALSLTLVWTVAAPPLRAGAT